MNVHEWTLVKPCEGESVCVYVCTREREIVVSIVCFCIAISQTYIFLAGACDRFRPVSYPMQAHPVDLYPAKCQQAACIMLMIMNNLDPRVAQFPHELITYGGNGSVFSNW